MSFPCPEPSFVPMSNATRGGGAEAGHVGLRRGAVQF